jgi:hypothetical protein
LEEACELCSCLAGDRLLQDGEYIEDVSHVLDTEVAILKGIRSASPGPIELFIVRELLICVEELRSKGGVRDSRQAGGCPGQRGHHNLQIGAWLELFELGDAAPEIAVLSGGEVHLGEVRQRARVCRTQLVRAEQQAKRDLIVVEIFVSSLTDRVQQQRIRGRRIRSKVGVLVRRERDCLG